MKKMNYDILTPRGGLGELAGKLFATMLLHFVIPLHLI